MLSISKVSKILGVSPASVRKLCDSGVLPSVRPCGPGGHRRVPREALDRYMIDLSRDMVGENPELDEVLRRVKSLV